MFNSINDFYLQPALSSSTNLLLFFNNHLTLVPELGFKSVVNPASHQNFREQSRVTVVTFSAKRMNAGGYWERNIPLTLGVFFDEEPVMAIINSPNSNSPYPTHYVTNAGLYGEMVKYLFSLVVPEDHGEVDNEVYYQFARAFGGAINSEPIVVVPVPFDLSKFNRAVDFLEAQVSV